MATTPRRRFHPGDIIRITNYDDIWKVLHHNSTDDTITATSLHADPRIDATIPTAHATHTHQE